MGRKEQRKEKTKTRLKTNKKPKQISIFTLLFILTIVAVCIGIYVGARYLVITLKYKQYTDKIIEYGFSELYDNKKATRLCKRNPMVLLDSCAVND